MKGIRVKCDTKNEHSLKTFRLHSLCIPQGGGRGQRTFLGDLKFFGKGQGGFNKFFDRRIRRFSAHDQKGSRDN